MDEGRVDLFERAVLGTHVIRDGEQQHVVLRLPVSTIPAKTHRTPTKHKHAITSTLSHTVPRHRSTGQ